MKLKLSTVYSALFTILLFVIAASAQSNNHSKTGDEKSMEDGAKQTENKSSEDKPLKIIKREPPRVRAFEKCFADYGTTFLSARVKVTFHSSAKVTEAFIDSTSGCEEFDDEAVRVAYKIKFEPAVKDGAPITKVLQVVYQGGIR